MRTLLMLRPPRTAARLSVHLPSDAARVLQIRVASKVLFPVVAGSWHVFEDGQRRPYSLATNYDPLYDIPPLYNAQVTSQLGF